MLGWNPGDEREMFTIEEASKIFSLDKVVKSGARFSPDKARWFNEQYLRAKKPGELVPALTEMASLKGIVLNEMQAEVVLRLMLERVSFLHEVLDAKWLFGAPLKEDFDGKMVRKKWKPETAGYMSDLKSMLSQVEPFKADEIETNFKSHLEKESLGFGQVLLPFRLALTGSGGGPSMFEFAAFLGLEKTLERLDDGIEIIENILLEE